MKYPNHHWLRDRDVVYLGEVCGEDIYKHGTNFFKITGNTTGRWIIYRGDPFKRASNFDQAQLDFCLAYQNLIS